MNQPDSLPITDEPSRPGHETKDVSPYYVGVFGVGLLIMVAIVLAIQSWMFHRLELDAERRDPAPSPVADTQTPPPPRLQTDPAVDLADMRQEDEQTLSTYRWIDQREERVRIPVDRAIAILAERGFPEPPAPPPRPNSAGSQEPANGPRDHIPSEEESASSAAETQSRSAQEPQVRRQHQPIERQPSVAPVEAGR